MNKKIRKTLCKDLINCAVVKTCSRKCLGIDRVIIAIQAEIDRCLGETRKSIEHKDLSLNCDMNDYLPPSELRAIGFNQREKDFRNKWNGSK